MILMFKKKVLRKMYGSILENIVHGIKTNKVMRKIFHKPNIRICITNEQKT